MTQRGGFAGFLVSPSSSWAGVLVLLGLGIVGNIVAAIIGIVTENSLWWLAVSALALLALLAGVYLVWHRSKPVNLVAPDQEPAKHKGLIVLVGTGRPGEDPMDQSAWSAIEYHMSRGGEGLQMCWLIASAGERGSLPVARRLQELCAEQNIQSQIRTVTDIWGVQETYDLVNSIYTQETSSVGLTEDEVIADFTGGVKTMSAGMILACGDRRPMQYMFGRKPGVASVPRLVEFRPN